MTTGAIVWAHPWVLPLLLAVPVFVLWARRRPTAAVAMPRAGSLRHGRARYVRWVARMPELLRGLAFLLLVLAVARPLSGGTVIEQRVDGIPIMIAFDISSSMLAEDFSPLNRLEVARETTREFIASRAADPIGLVAFAGEAITQVPLTTNQRVLFAAIDNLRIGLLEDGTAIGMGLAMATTRLQGVDADERVVILMSDGENNRGEIEPLDAAHAARELGIRVYTVGVGTDQAAPVPLRRGPDGAVLQYAELPVGIDEELLREIASLTGGAYFRADTPDALRRVYAELDRLVGSPMELRQYVDYREWYWLLLLAGAAALLAEWFLRGSRWGRLP